MLNKKHHTIAIIIALAVFAIISILFLPAKVALQISTGGGLQNVVPKFVAIAIPLAISGICLYFMNKSENPIRPCLVAWLGVLIQPLTLLINLLSNG